MIRRVQAARRIEPVAGHDLITLCYTSADFREGVEAFLAKRAPRWQALLFTRLGEGLVTWGVALQRRYRRANSKPALPVYSRHDAMEQTL
jgi:hypothetical protein